MSSRALRKLQRDQEEQEQLAALKQKDEDESEDDNRVPPSGPLNAFEMLNGDDGEGGVVTLESGGKSDSETEANKVNANEIKSTSPKSKKTKKKKSKNKGKAVEPNVSKPRKNRAMGSSMRLDEIDLALKSLSTSSRDDSTKSVGVILDEGNALLYLLAVESKHLNALTEMKRLFGNVVMENEEDSPAVPRRRTRAPQQVDLGGALTARNSPVSRGQGLKGLALKRNCLIMGKEEWPQATSGGLGMELLEKMEDGTVEYRFIHNSIYQDVQRQFESCVESMDPQRMIAMLQFNPYHVSTLLQVSEIAKQQGDHSVSGDLLERALFTFGRSVHSSFTHALSEGKARLDFRRPENREFWLAAWRYTNNLGQRGTWRTAYEWAKLILSLDPEGDPFCVAKNLDQLALRGGLSEHYLQLYQHPFFSDDLWKPLPNVYLSASLAQYRLKQSQACRSTLTKAVTTFPWIFTRLFQELNLSHIPKSIWGKTPRTDREKFDTELYVHHAKDLWTTPEAIAFLVEVVEAAPSSSPLPPSGTPITLDEARHVLLSGIPSLINLIPRAFTSMQTTSADPLPPADNLPSYDSRIPQTSSNRNRELEHEYADLSDVETLRPNENPTDATAVQELRGLSGLFSRLIPWLGQSTGNGRINDSRTDAEIEQAAAEEGITRAELEQRQGRFMELLDRALGRRGGRDADRELAVAAGLRQPPLTGEREVEMRGEHAGADDESPPLSQDPRNYAYDDDHVNEYNEDAEEQGPADERSHGHVGLIPAGEVNIVPQPAPPSPHSPLPAATEQEEAVSDDRLQRYLAGTGLIRLKEYITTHGTDENGWPDNEGYDLLHEYAIKVKQLKNSRTREFIMNYVLPQGTGKEVKTLVERTIRELH
ncbi:MAG: hypothetical protein Q9217_004075 [Psora testacea]